MFKIFSKKNGFTLIELLTVVAIMGILVAIAPLWKDFIYSHRLHAASRELYSDLLAMRFAAITRSSVPESHGFGIRFLSESEYTVFEFVDDPSGTAFKFDVATEDDIEDFQKELPTGVTVTVGDDGTPVGNANLRLYDKHGMLRKWDWSNVANLTYVLRHPKAGNARCVVISAARVREGSWDDITNNCNEL